MSKYFKRSEYLYGMRKLLDLCKNDGELEIEEEPEQAIEF